MNNIVFMRLDSTNSEMHLNMKKQVLVQNYLFGICLSGSSKVQVNTKTYLSKKNTALIILPNSTVITKEVSKDYTGLFIVINKEGSRAIALFENTPYYKYIYANPIAELSDEKGLVIKTYLELIHKLIKSEEKHISTDIVLNLLISACELELGGLFLKEQSSFTTEMNHPHFSLFRNFLNSIIKHHKKEKEVAFYAEQNNMSRRYFSQIIKEVSGQSPKQWINLEVLQTSKYLLRSSKLSIVEIAKELDFTHASAFGSFFKAQMEITPTEYREKQKFNGIDEVINTQFINHSIEDSELLNRFLTYNPYLDKTE